MAIKMPSQQELEDAQKRLEAEGAIDRYLQMIEKGLGNEAVYYNLGVYLMSLKRWNEARGAFEKALELQPELLQAMVNLGGVLFHLKEYEKSLEVTRKALDIKPDFIHARNNYAMGLLSVGRVEESVTELKKVLEIEPKHPAALAAMARAYGFLGEEEKMKEYIELAKAAGVNFS